MAKKKEIIIREKGGKPIDVPVEGSLGLLALGHLGLLVWRKKRMEAADEKNK